MHKTEITVEGWHIATWGVIGNPRIQNNFQAPLPSLVLNVQTEMTILFSIHSSAFSVKGAKLCLIIIFNLFLGQMGRPHCKINQEIKYKHAKQEEGRPKLAPKGNCDYPICSSTVQICNIVKVNRIPITSLPLKYEHWI